MKIIERIAVVVGASAFSIELLAYALPKLFPYLVAAFVMGVVGRIVFFYTSSRW